MLSAPAKAYNQLSKHISQWMHTVSDVNVQNGKAISDLSFFPFLLFFFFLFLSLPFYRLCFSLLNTTSKGVLGREDRGTEALQLRTKVG